MKKKVLFVLLVLSAALGLLPAAALAVEPLATPTELEWGKAYSEGGSGGTQTCAEVPGTLSWKKEMPHQEKFRVSIYDGGGKQIASNVWVSPGEGYASVDEFILRSKDLDSGDYSFSVQAVGDEVSYSDGGEARSQSWTYTRPAAELPAVTGLRWSWPQAQWTALTGQDFSCYDVQWFYSETENGDYEELGNDWRITEPYAEIRNIYIQDRGLGYYKFRVRGVSGDITRVQHSPWSEFSPAFNLTDLSDSVKNALDAITSDDAEVIRNEVYYNINPDGLKTAMAADDGSGGIISRLAELERKAGGPARTEVTGNALPGFTAGDVSVVGAGLNTPAGDGGELKLTVGQPEDKDLVIPTLLSSTLAVRFSMDLEGVAWPEALEVPVKVTLPIPGAIDPDFLRIVHYPAGEGEPEIMGPLDYHVFRRDGKPYVSFVLTHFSDFVMTELKREEPGAKVSLRESMFEVDTADVVYNGRAQEPKVEAKSAGGSSGAGVLQLNTDYTVSYRDNVNAGTASILITGQGGYTGTLTYSFTISRATVTVTAGNVSHTVGGAAPVYGYTVSGLVSEEDWQTKPDASCPTADLNAEGSYVITVSGGVLKGGNYNAEVVYVPGTLTVRKSGGGSTPSYGGGGGGSSSSASPGEKHTVSASAVSGGKVTLNTSGARKGDTVTLTAAPDKGYRLEKLAVTDKNGKELALKELGGGKFSFTMPDGKVEVKASFAAEPERTDGSPAVQPVDDRFGDVGANSWYKDAVQYVYDRGMMTGMTQENFGPDAPASRGMLVTILYRMEEGPEAGQAGFSDVAGTAYYAQPVAWAVEKGLVTGYGDGSFRPNEQITREQLAAILYRYAGLKGFDTAKGEKDAGFQDGAVIQRYAREAVEWAASIGLVNGYRDGSFRPGGTATRAEVAAMLMRFCQEAAKPES